MTTTDPNMMTVGEFRRQREEMEYAGYLAEGQAEADALDAGLELQRRRDAFAAEVLSDPLLAAGADVAAVELLRVTTTSAVAQYVATVDQRNSAIHEARRRARELDLEGVVDQVVCLARSTDPAAALRIDGRTVEANSAWQRTAERCLADAVKTVRQRRSAR